MRNAYFLLLLVLLEPGRAWGQKPTPTQLKGRLWMLTAHRIWRDTKLVKQSKPKDKNFGSSKEFEKWTKETGRADQSGLVALRDSVVDELKGVKEPTPTQVAQAIKSEVAKMNIFQKIDKAKLEREFDSLLTKYSFPTINQAILKKRKADDSIRLAAEDSARQRRLRRGPEKPHSDSRNPDSGELKFGLLALLLTGGLCLGLGVLASRLYRSAPETRATSASKPKSHDFGDINQQTGALERQRLQTRIDKLEELLRKTQQPDEDANPVISPLQRQPADQPVGPDASISGLSTPSVVEPQPGMKLFRRYASAALGGQLSPDSLKEESMSRMALQVEVNEKQPNQATFTLNPGVDKNWLIGADLEKLRHYFTFTLPTDRWPSSVAAVGPPGILTRQGDIWQVTQKARLDVH